MDCFVLKKKNTNSLNIGTIDINNPVTPIIETTLNPVRPSNCLVPDLSTYSRDLSNSPLEHDLLNFLRFVNNIHILNN